MGGHSIFVPTRTAFLRELKSLIPKEERTREKAEALVNSFLKSRMCSPIDVEQIFDETEWLGSGGRTYFPVKAELMPMLWKARMNVDMDDLELPSFPRGFSVAWPKCEVDGVELPGCLVGWGFYRERSERLKKFCRERIGIEPQMDVVFPEDMESLILSVSFRGFPEPAALMTRPMLLVTVPSRALKACLSSSDGFRAEMSGKVVPGSVPLNDEEEHRQYVLVKMLVHLMVYMKACPGMVSAGYPDGKDERDFGYQKWLGLSASAVGAPERLGMGTHGSPEVHWRTWHFRSYPRQPDGKKKAGVVFVNGAMVGMDEKDPVTVEVVGSKVKE